MRNNASRVLLGVLATAMITAPAASARLDVAHGVARQPDSVVWAHQLRTSDSAQPNWGMAMATSPDGSLVFVAAKGTDLAYEAATGRLRWAAPNETTAATGATGIGVSPSGSIVVSVGERSFPDPQRILSAEIVVTGHDPTTGRQRWQARHRGPDNGGYTASTVVVTDGLVFVAGQRLELRQMVLLAFDATTGRERWLAYHGPAKPYAAKPVGLVATPDGRRVFVTAMSWEHNPYVEWVTVAYDGATGEELWMARHSGPAKTSAQPNGMVLRSDGELLYVTGWDRGQGLGAGFDFLTIAYDTSTGSPAWSGRWSSGANSDNLAWSVDISPDGRRLYVAGYGSSPTPGYWVEARSARSGEPLWSSPVPLLVPTQDHEGLFGLAKIRSSPDGRNVYVAMSAHDQAALSERDISYAVAGYDATTGAFLWRAAHRDPDTVEASYMKDFAVDPSGQRLYVTGEGWNPGRGVVQTAAFAVEGPSDDQMLAVPRR